MRRKILAIPLLTAAIVALSTLAGGQTVPTSAAPAPDARAAAAALNAAAATHSRAGMTNVHFILNWLPNVEFAGLWVAQKKGWFQQAGINMTFKPWAAGVEPTTEVPEYSGNAFGFQSGAAIAIAVAQGVPIKAVYTDTQRSVFGLTVMANSKITKLTDLKGKRVGYQSDEFYVPATMLSCVGLSQNMWRPVQVGFDISQLTAGQVDAYLTFLTNEPIALALQGVKTRSFPASQYCFHFYDDVMFTTNSLISKNPALVRKVTQIAARGFMWAHEHPVAAAKLTVANYFPAAKGSSASLNLKQQIMELQKFSEFSRDSTGKFSGLMKASYWQDSVNTLYKYGQIKSKPAVSSLFTNEFNPNK